MFVERGLGGDDAGLRAALKLDHKTAYALTSELANEYSYECGKEDLKCRASSYP
jgi:hypothetical protein